MYTALPAFVLLLSLSACTGSPMAEGLVATPTRDLHGPAMGPVPDPLRPDVVQHTCALYVAIRAAALEHKVFFGRDPEDLGVHWNMCPGGTLVACAEAPTASGDTIRTGIPWPY